MESIAPANLFKDQGKLTSVGRSRHEWKYKSFSYLLLTLIGLTMIIPFIWMLSTSLKPETEILRRDF